MPKEAKSGSFIKRHVVGALVLPVLFAYVYYLPSWPYFFALLAVVAVLAMGEFHSMYRVPARLSVPGMVIGAALLYLSCRYPEYFIHGVLIGLFLLLVLRLFLVPTPAGCMSEVGPVALSFFYIAFFLSFQWLLISGENGLEHILLLYVSVWLADSMAYYIGTYLGRNRLYPAVSPKKTVEGAFGSLAGGALGAVIINKIYDIPDLSVAGAAAVGTTLGIAALVGDLIESMFKRDAGVKDSSNFIPGHGGILDKIDGFLVAGPMLYLIVRWF